MNQFILSEQRHNQIFTSEIVPQFVDKLSPADDQPTLIFLGGQTGSGKSTISNQYREDNFLIIDAAAYRRFHPDNDRLTKENPLTAAQLMRPDTNLWAKQLAQYAAKHKLNTVIETTFDNPESIIELAAIFSKEHYNTNLVLISAPEKTSWLATLKRFEQAYEQDPASACPVSKAQHDAQYRAIPETLREVYDKQAVSHLRIIDRDQNPVFTDRVTNAVWHLANKNPLEILLEHRAKLFDLKQIEQHRQDWQYVLSAMENRHAPPKEIFAAKMLQTHYESEFRNPNVLRQLAIDPTYKEDYYNNIETNIIDKPLPDHIKLKLIEKVYSMAETKIKVEKRKMGDKLLIRQKQATAPEVEQPRIKINHTQTKTKDIEH